MERSLLSELNKKNITAYINRAREVYLKRLFWTMFFGLKYTTQLTWESLSGSAGTPVMADVIEYNASAPLKTRRVITKQSGDIPKIAIKRKMDEKDYNDYMNMKARASGDANKIALLDLVFQDLDFCYLGVLARTEHLCLQALSYGKISLTNTNNQGIVTKTSVDFGVPSGNKTAVSTIWATAGSATPLADIEAKVKAAEDAGHNISSIVMDKATFNQLIATTEAKDTFASFQRVDDNKKAFLMLQDINLWLSGHMLPPITVVNSTVRFENKTHTLSNVAPWNTGYVAFLTNKKVGNVKHGPIAEETAASVKKIALLTKKDHVLITKWSELEPFSEFTKGQANAFPTFNDVDSIYLLKTNGTSWS